jgi:hypothetical protein
LVDPYGTPYHPNSRHQTFTVGKPLKQQSPHSHQKSLSIHLSSKASKHSEDQDTLYNYPPPPPQEKVEAQSLWQKVETVTETPGIHGLTSCFVACSRIDSMPSICRHSPSGNSNKSRHRRGTPFKSEGKDQNRPSSVPRYKCGDLSYACLLECFRSCSVSRVIQCPPIPSSSSPLLACSNL